ncbi:MAG: hypothetical protein MJ033_06590 [Victivallaceae bacterium]|nr:hypothetical protein [Victivallaceae bacterium]
MKKFFAVLLLSVAGITVFAAENAATFRSIRCMEYYPRTIDKCQSGEIVYDFEDSEGVKGMLVFRQKGKELARVDFIMGDTTDSTGYDGKQFWSCDKNGCEILKENEAAEFVYDLSFVAIPLREDEIFRNLKKVGEESFDNELCIVYETAPVDAPEIKTELLVSKASGLLRKVVTVDGGVTSSVVFDDYVSVDGVRVANTVIKSNDAGTTKLLLRAARWNVDFAADVFAMPEKMKNAVAVKSNVQRPAQTADPAREKSLRSRITELENNIRIVEEKISKMEELHNSNRAAEVQLSSAPVTARYYGYWRRHGFRHAIRRSTRRAMRDRRRVIKQLVREDNKVAAEYEKALKELTKLRSELSMAQEDLKLLNSGK